MKAYTNLWMLMAALLLGIGVQAQTFNLNNEASNLFIEGTSNIHDWTIEAEKTKGILILKFDEDGLDEIQHLEFVVVAESLKSGKGGMDKNTFRALNTKKFNTITFRLKEIKDIRKVNSNTYAVKALGSLEISGTKKDIDLDFHLKATTNQVELSGEHKLNMNHYGVEAPTAMFGTIKTGEEVVVKFKSQFRT